MFSTSDEEAVLLVAFELEEDSSDDKFLWVRQQFDSCFDICEVFERGLVSDVKDFKHVFFADAGQEFELVPSCVDWTGFVEEFDEAGLALGYKFVDDEVELVLSCFCEFGGVYPSDDVVDLVSFAFSDVDFFIGLQEDVFFGDEFKKDEAVFADGLGDGCFFVQRSFVKRVAVWQEVQDDCVFFFAAHGLCEGMGVCDAC